MNLKFWTSATSLATFAICFALVPDASFAKAEQDEVKELRWQINHYPQKYFVEAAAKLNEILQTSDAGKRVKIIPVVPKDVSWNIERLASVTKLGVRNGDYEIAQAYTFSLTEFDEKLKVFDMPYLFEGHDHFERVVESQVGEQIVARLRDFGYEPLAVTYSGGMVAIPARKALRTPADFKGVRYKAWEHNTNYETHRHLQTSLVNAFEIISKAYKTKEFSVGYALKNKMADAADCEIAELGQLEDQQDLVFNLLEHRMLATVLLMHKGTFDALPKDTQAALKKASVEAARWERHEIIKSEESIVARLKSQGRTVVTLSDLEKAAMRKAVAPVHSYFEPVVGTKLLKDIKQMGKTNRKLVRVGN